MGRARLRGFVLESVSALGIRVAQGLSVHGCGGTVSETLMWDKLGGYN